MPREYANYDKLAEIAFHELRVNHGLQFEIDFGDPFFNSLFWGTLKSIVERVDSSGFCSTSYGEIGNVKCYGVTHYPRDTAEAAIVLAKVGLQDKAVRILDFTLRNIPNDQNYIPHVYNFDGSIRANTIQNDTPGIVAIALEQIYHDKSFDTWGREAFNKLQVVFQTAWQNSFHKELKLLDAGNYNEQFDGGNEPICDIFTNTAFYAGLISMSKIAKAIGEQPAEKTFADMASILTDGIEQSLRDDRLGVYQAGITVTGRYLEPRVNWHSLYCSRWYPMDLAAQEKAFQLLSDQAVIWNGYKILPWEPSQQFGVLGKIYAQALGFLAKTKHAKILAEYLCFARETICKPVNIFPEWWYLSPMKNPNPYWKGFFKKYAGVWQSFGENPHGDYTIDSGNCEQSAVFLHHMIDDLSSIDLSAV